MIVVVASAFDPRARSVVEQWGSHCATMLTAEDLCKPGWQFTVPGSPNGMAVIGGKVVADAEIQGVLTLRPCIYPEELLSTGAAHRSYIAAELNAFLLAWLAARTCPVVNRPTACCLAGPNWCAEQWTLAVARQGIPAEYQRTVPARRELETSPEACEIITVAERCFGCQDSTLRRTSLQLARAAGVELLSVRFSKHEGHFLSATTWPALAQAEVLVALRELLGNRRESRA